MRADRLAGARQSLTGLSATFAGKNTSVLTWKFCRSRRAFTASLAKRGGDRVEGCLRKSDRGVLEGFEVLYGDVSDDRKVDKTDETLIRQSVVAPYHMNPAIYNIFADLSGDGLVNLVDVGTARARKGNKLP